MVWLWTGSFKRGYTGDYIGPLKGGLYRGLSEDYIGFRDLISGLG